MPGFINDFVSNINVRGARRSAGEFNRVALGQERLKEAGDGLNTTLTRQRGIASSVVGQYASLAGSLFTLSLSYRALSDAAQVGQALQGLSSLAAQSAQNGRELLESVQGITKQQVAISDAVRAINLAISSGFSTEQIEGLSEVSLRASKALGIDLENAYGRVTRASAKLETELLDELGIYTKIIPASQVYARSIGRTVSELTEFERRQAFVTGVITEGQRKFGAINTTVDTTAEAFNRFATTLKDIGTNLGIIIGDFVAPILRELTSNVGLISAGLGIFFSSVAKRSLPVIGNVGSDIGRAFINRIAKGVYLPGEVGSRIFENIEDFGNKNLPKLGENLAERLRHGITSQLGNRLNYDESRQFSNYLGLIRKNLRTELKEITDNLQAAPNSRFLRNRYKAVRSELKTVFNGIEEVNRSVAAGSTLLGRLQLRGITAFRGLGRAAAVAGSAITKAFTVGPQAFAITALFANAIGRGEDFNDVILDIRDNLTELFSGRAQAGRGFVSAIIDKELKALEEINTELKDLENFSFSRRVSVPLLSLVFGDIEVDSTRTKEQLSREIGRALSEIANDKSFLDSVLSKSGGYGALTGALTGTTIGAIFGGPAGASLGAGVGAILGGLGGATLDSIYSSIGDLDREKVKQSLRGSGALQGFSEDLEERFLTQLATIRRARDSAVTQEGFDYYQLQEDILISSSKYLRNVREINTLTKITGQSSAAITSNYKFADNAASTLLDTTTKIGDSTFRFSFFNRDLEAVRELFSNLPAAAGIAADRVTSTIDDITSSSVRSVEVIRQAQEGLITNISLEQFEKNIGSSESSILSIQRDIVVAYDQQATLRKEIADLTGLEKSEAQAVLGFNELRLINLVKQLGTIRDITEETKAFRDIVQQQEDLNAFSASLQGKRVNPYQGLIDALSSGGISTLQSLNVFGQDTQDDLNLYTRKLDEVTAKTRNLGLDQQATTLISDTTVENLELSVRSLNRLRGVSARINDNGTGILVTTRKWDDAVGAVEAETEEIVALSATQLRLGKEALTVYDLQSTAASRLAGTLVDVLLNENRRLDQATRTTRTALDEIANNLRKYTLDKLILDVEFEADLGKLDRDLKELIQETAIQNLELDKVLIEGQIDAGLGTVKEFNDISNRLIQAEKDLVTTQIRGIREALADETILINQRKINDIDTINIQSELRRVQTESERDAALADIATRRAQIEAINSLNNKQLEGLRSVFNAFGKSFAEVLSQGAAALGRATTIDFTDVKEVDQVSVGAARALTSLDASESEIARIYDKLIMENSRLSAAEIANIRQKATNEQALAERESYIAEQRIRQAQSVADRERQINKQLGDDNIRYAKRFGETLVASMASIFSSIQTNLSSALSEFNTLYAFNESRSGLTNDQTEKQIVSDLFRNVQQDVFKTTIADPLSSYVTDGVAGLFGITERRGIENAKVDIRTGALLVKNVDGDGFTNIGNPITTAANFASGLKNDTFGTLLGLLPGFASGGLIRTAKQYAAGGLLRDSQPALVEPGEFIVRKSAVREAGVAGLNRLNATGSLKTATPQVEVNVINNGASQQVESTKTRVEGDKYIIDVVTRDMQNNGRIRQQMRRG